MIKPPPRSTLRIVRGESQRCRRVVETQPTDFKFKLSLVQTSTFRAQSKVHALPEPHFEAWSAFKESLPPLRKERRLVLTGPFTVPVTPSHGGTGTAWRCLLSPDGGPGEGAALSFYP